MFAPARNDATVPADLPEPTAQSPQRFFLAAAANRRFRDVAQRCDDVQHDTSFAIVRGYSCKTNPAPEMLALARAHGFFAEVISADERGAARDAGFPGNRIIHNGPEAPRPADGRDPVAYCFADSLEAFEANVRNAVSSVAGVRMRPAMISSRFGIPVEEDDALIRAVTRAGVDVLACSLHVRREDFHGASWRDVCADVIERAARLETATGVKVVAFDVGGGWQPREFDDAFAGDAAWAIATLRVLLPNVRTLIVEPGQAVATCCEALVANVLEVRERRGRREVIVDVGYNDWSQQHSFDHRIFVASDGVWTPVGHGGDRLGGKTCLEYDVLEGLRFPPDVRAGDRILIADVGAYDASMAFSFARATRPPIPLTVRPS